MMRRGYLLSSAAAAVLSLASLSAQVTGRLSGSVVDASGGAIPGAKVDVLLQGGASAVFSATTSAEGAFLLTGVRSEFYDVTVAAPGFITTTLRRVKVDPGRDTVLPPIKLEVATVTQVIDVAATVQNVQTSNAEIATTVTTDQVRRLPLLNRSPLALIGSQAGVNDTGRTNTVINGQRTSFTNVTLDGINIQDNFIRSNALDFLPNMLLQDQVAEITVATTTANAALGGGASQVVFVTPSGTNAYHGSGYWYNRNNALAANTWFNNKDGIPRAFLNQNQVGGSVGGPIVKDKLLFYTNYEAFRLRQKSTFSRTILTESARQGLFTYRDRGGVVRQLNVLQAAGVGFDPYIQNVIKQVPGPEKINNFRVGDSREGFLRNTAGYTFQGRNNRTRDNITVKLDFMPSTRHMFTGTYVGNRDDLDRTDLMNDFSTVPKVSNAGYTNLTSAAWRWNPAPVFTNELRGGFNLAPARFNTNEEFGQLLVGGLIFSNPVNTFRGQGRDTNTYTILDNATWVRGRHSFQFGFQSQRIRTAPFNDAGITPTYSLGMSTANQSALRPEQFPGGAEAADVAAANSLLANLAGFISSYTQTFNVTSRDSGFVPGATNRRRLALDNYSGFLQDTWKVRPRLTLTLGVRYEYFTVLDEKNSLFLLPVLKDNNPITTLLSNSTLDFAGKSAGRPWYGADRNNFGPTIGLAWDVFGNGKTALRAGYSMAFVNDETITSIRNNVNTNDGLSTGVTASGLTARISAPPSVPTPTLRVPRTFEDNYRLNTQAAFGLPDPGLRTPYVQQWSFGIQQDVKGTTLDVRYVGNKTTKSFRAFDYNQVIIKENGFLADFRRAQSNAELARAQTGAYDPRYSASIAGSQPLTVFPLLANGGSLTTGTNLNYLQTGQVGEMASNYQVTRTNGAVNFYRNPLGLGMNYITNYSNASYNAFQIEARRHTRNGLNLQANYAFSKVLADALGDGQTRFEAFLDMENPKIERARAPFDVTHAFKANAVYDLPLGEGHRIDYRPLRRVLSGWSVSGISLWQSGTPFSIASGRASLNRAARSGVNTATTTLTGGQLDNVIGFRMTGNGPMMVDASILDRSGRAAVDGTPFSGQVFFNPAPGNLGALQRRMFTGPSVFNLDFGIQKLTRITETQSVELRMESTNILNHPTFDFGDDNINSVNFGRITSTYYGRRLIQFGLYYRF